MKVRCPKGLTATPPNQQGWINRTEKEKFVIDKQCVVLLGRRAGDAGGSIVQ